MSVVNSLKFDGDMESSPDGDGFRVKELRILTPWYDPIVISDELLQGADDRFIIFIASSSHEGLLKFKVSNGEATYMIRKEIGLNPIWVGRLIASQGGGTERI
jgi:hypothetical protein